MFKTPSFLKGAVDTLKEGVSTMQETVGTAGDQLKKTITGTQQGIHKSVHEGTEALVGPKQSSTSAEVPTDNIKQDSRDHIQKIQTKVRKITKGILPFSDQYNKLVEKSGKILAEKHLQHLAAANRAQEKGAMLSSQIAKSTNPMGTPEQRDQGRQHDVAHLQHRLVAGLYNSALKTVVGAEHHQRYLDNAQAKLRSQTVQGGKRKHKRKTMKRKSNKRKHKKRHATKKRKHKKRHQTKKRKHKKAHKKKAHKKKHRRTKKQRGGQCPCSGV